MSFGLFPIIAGITLVFGYAVLGGGWLKAEIKVCRCKPFCKSRSPSLYTPVLPVCLAQPAFYAVNIQPTIHSAWQSHRIALPSLLVSVLLLRRQRFTAVVEKE